MVEPLLNFFHESTMMTFLVIGLLVFYFIGVNWIFLFRLSVLRKHLEHENRAFKSILSGNERISEFSIIKKYVKAKQNNDEVVSENLLKVIKFTVTKDATKGLHLLSIVASTSPFIGLFGTVVSILETFATLGDSELSAISVIAQGVSEALIATAVGIFVATFAYTYHQIVKRKAYELVEIVGMEAELILFGNKKNSEIEKKEIEAKVDSV
jgi:biopolymer transport protein ExbB/TolQ